MALLRPKHKRRRTSIARRTTSIIECPYNGHQVSWCMHLCDPVDGRGHCGRVASHDMLGRTQLSIINYKARKF